MIMKCFCSVSEGNVLGWCTALARCESRVGGGRWPPAALALREAEGRGVGTDWIGRGEKSSGRELQVF